jgi:ABC-2 type transport system ATP-binding protein
MLIIDKGRKVVEGAVKELFDPARTIVELDSLDSDLSLKIVMEGKWQPFFRERQGQRLILLMDKALIPDLATDLVRQGAQISAIRPRHSLEDYFLSLTTANQHVDAFAN